MARVETPRQPLQTLSIKPKSANLCRFFLLITITAFCTVAYFISKRPLDVLGDPSDQFTVKNVPHTRLEGLDPEDREVFNGFRTSFLPEEIVLARRDPSNSVPYEGNVGDANSVRKQQAARVKRGSHFGFTSQDYE